MNIEELRKVLNKINEVMDRYLSRRGKIILIAVICAGLAAGVVFSGISSTKTEMAALPIEDNIEQAVQEEALQNDAVSEIEIEDIDKTEDKIVSFAVEDFGRPDPFLPASDVNFLINNSSKYGYVITAPPETLATETEATKIVQTKVSGIMYEPKNPSAILNIEGADYLVRSGDYINNYKVLSINKDIVTVQLGANVYKARVGEVLPDGEINYNNIYNLENKFGGAKK